MTSLNQLFVDTPRWVHRKVESTKFAADGATRVQMSMDFTLPQAAVDFKVLPLGFLKKQTLHSFDISDASGAALSLLTRTQNTDLAVDLLLENSEDALTLNDRSLLKRIVHSAPNEIPEGMKAYSDLISLGEYWTRLHRRSRNVFLNWRTFSKETTFSQQFHIPIGGWVADT